MVLVSEAKPPAQAEAETTTINPMKIPDPREWLTRLAYRLYLAEIEAGLHRVRRPLLVLAIVCAVVGVATLLILFFHH